jgi:hypothetical protein
MLKVVLPNACDGRFDLDSRPRRKAVTEITHDARVAVRPQQVIDVGGRKFAQP